MCVWGGGGREGGGPIYRHVQTYRWNSPRFFYLIDISIGMRRALTFYEYLALQPLVRPDVVPTIGGCVCGGGGGGGRGSGVVPFIGMYRCTAGIALVFFFFYLIDISIGKVFMHFVY